MLRTAPPTLPRALYLATRRAGCVAQQPLMPGDLAPRAADQQPWAAARCIRRPPARTPLPPKPCRPAPHLPHFPHQATHVSLARLPGCFWRLPPFSPLGFLQRHLWGGTGPPLRYRGLSRVWTRAGPRPPHQHPLALSPPALLSPPPVSPCLLPLHP